MNIKKSIEEDLTKVLKKHGFDEKLSAVAFSNREGCDFQCNGAFSIAKNIGENPLEVATLIANELPKNDNYKVEACKPGFINFTISNKALSDQANEILLDTNCGVEKNETSKKVLMDYGGANVAKELHIGHLRSPILGESLRRLYILLGDNVISDTHLGDWGLQMGLNIAQLEEDGVLEFYFGRSKDKIEITMDMLNSAYPKASKRKNTDDKFKKKAEDYTLFVQQYKEPYYSIYSIIKDLSVKRIKENYDKLGAHFDYWFGESDAMPYVNQAIQIFKDKNLTKISNGALIVEVACEGENIATDKRDENGNILYKNPMPPVILQKANGGDIYHTTEIATILMRNTMFDLDKIVYLTDNRQAQHFKQVFRACKMSGISPLEQELLHIEFGTMNGKDGKPFKTRNGEVLKLEDIINLVKDKAAKKLEKNGIANNDQLALDIGMAAMKFGDMSNTISKDYVFDIDKFLSFEGKTGPYIQYTVARINSILSKAGDKDVKRYIDIVSEEERRIVIAILKLIASYKICYKDNSLNMLCESVYDLASAFSTFYNNVKILSEPNLEKKESYLTLCKLVRKCISQALFVLGINTLEKM